MTNKTYRLYPKTIDDLEGIYLYSVTEFGIQRTEDYLSAIRILHQSMDFNRLIK